MEKLNKQEILQVTRKINANNFYDFIERYDLTYGELLGAIDFQIHSSSSLLIENSLRNLLNQKQILFCVNDKKVGLFADFHVGHTQANWDYIYRGYDFCFEEGIDTIIILGDLLHGPYKWASNNYNKAIFQCYQQLVELQEHLPKGFSTFLLGGNHEEEFYKVGGFPEKTIMNEDVIIASKFIFNNKKTCYASKAEVIHSHNYTYIQQFKRNFDVGVVFADSGHYFAGVKSESEGIKFVKEAIRYLIKRKKVYLIPHLIIESGFKFIGYKLGSNYKKLPMKYVKKMSMHSFYFDKKDMNKNKEEKEALADV